MSIFKNVRTQEKKKLDFRSFKRKKKFDRLQNEIINNFKDVSIPKKGEVVEIITNKHLNAFVMLEMLAQKNTCEELYLSMYCISKYTTLKIVEMIKSGLIKKAYFVISNLMKTNKQTKEFANILYNLSLNNSSVDFKAVCTHTKIALMKFGEDYFVFTGSGNVSNNARYEQYTLQNNNDLYNFYKNWMISV